MQSLRSLWTCFFTVPKLSFLQIYFFIDRDAKFFASLESFSSKFNCAMIEFGAKKYLCFSVAYISLNFMKRGTRKN